MGGGDDGGSSFVTHHAGRNGSTPDHRPSSAAVVGGPVVTAERRSGNADPPGLNAVGDDNAGGCDHRKGGNGDGDNDNADCPDNDSNNSIQENGRGHDCKMVCWAVAKAAEMLTANLLPNHHIYYYFYVVIGTVYIQSIHVPGLRYKGKL